MVNEETANTNYQALVEERAKNDAAPSEEPHQEEEVRLRAYAIWEEKGGTHGHDVEDWLEASEELFPPN